MLIGLAIFGCAEVWGANWKLYVSTEGGDYFYDVDSITTPSKDIVRGWEKKVYSDKGIIETVAEYGAKYKELSYTINFTEYNCKEKRYRHLLETYCSKEGKVLVIFEDLPWRFFPPGTIVEELSKILCK